MADITQEQRSRGWNIKFMAGREVFAGIYQHEDMLTIGDVARDLELCIVFMDRPTTGTPDDWQPVLLPQVSTLPCHVHIVLDKTSTQPFPAPTSTAVYTYALHAVGQCTLPSRQLHAFDSACYHKPVVPTRRYNPKYAPISKLVASTSCSPSASSILSDIDDERIPIANILPDTARSIVREFHANVSGAQGVCAISGKGAPWLKGVPGMGVEVAHIVPPIYWNFYPLGGDPITAKIEDQIKSEMAWRWTWMSSNGLLLLSHLNSCFQARLVTIHPQRRCVRAFAPYDILTDYNGKEARISSTHNVDTRALQHHYDMCCIENMVAPWVPDAPVPMSQPTAFAGNTASGYTMSNGNGHVDHVPGSQVR